MPLILPTTKIPAVSTNPKFIVIYGKPKAGKTSALAQLENNLIIDLEGGSQFIDAMAVQARNISELGEIAQAIRAKNNEVGHAFYRHITIDNATRLEEICLDYAATLLVIATAHRNMCEKFREFLEPLFPIASLLVYIN